MLWEILIGLVVLAGIGWAWVHYRKQTETTLDKVGKVVDDAVNKVEDKFK